MRPTRWRRSTHLAVGVAVLAVVAAVIAVAALLTGGRGSSAPQSLPVPAPATADPGVVPVADTPRCQPCPHSEPIDSCDPAHSYPAVVSFPVAPQQPRPLVPGLPLGESQGWSAARRDHRARHPHRADRDPVDRGQPGGQGYRACPLQRRDNGCRVGLTVARRVGAGGRRGCSCSPSSGAHRSPWVPFRVVLGLYVQSLFGRNATESPGSGSVAIAAPLIEEAAKGLFLLIMMTGRRRNELNSMTDCLVYAGITAAELNLDRRDILYIASGESRIRSGRSQRRSSRCTLQFRRPAHPGVSSGCSTQPVPSGGAVQAELFGAHHHRHAKAFFAASHRAHHRGGTVTTY